jgi:hypothetical protein
VSSRRESGLAYLWSGADALGTMLILVGVVAAVLGWRPSAWLLVGTVTALIWGRVAIAAVAYRWTMRRPWPQVQPLTDDDWDD